MLKVLKVLKVLLQRTRTGAEDAEGAASNEQGEEDAEGAASNE